MLSSPPPWASNGENAFRVRVSYVNKYIFRGLIIASEDPLFVGQELEYSLFHWKNKSFVEDPIYKEEEPPNIEDCM